MFGQALAVVKRAGHFERGYILAQRGELLFLRAADASGGIENHDADPGNSQERLRDRASRVARCRHDHGQLFSRFGDKISHQARHESRAKILERQRRPVK